MKEIANALRMAILLAIFGSIFICGFLSWRAYEDKRIFAPSPPKTYAELQLEAALREQELQNSIATSKFNAVVWSIVKVASLAAGVLTLFLVSYRFLYVPAVKRREEIHADSETGLYPVITRSTTRIGQRLRHGETEEEIINPNQIIGGMASIRRNGSTNAQVLHDSNASAQELVSLAREGKLTQRESARYGQNPKRGGGMNRAEADFYGGVTQAKRQQIEAKTALDQHRLEQRQAKALPEPVTRIVHDPINVTGAIAVSSENDWIIGQSTEQQPRPQDEFGKLLHYRPKNGHLAILGASGGGKTESSGFLVVFYARTFGYHTIVFDGKHGVDWGPMQHCLERYDMNHETLPSLWKALHREYVKRFQMLKQYGVKHVDSLPANIRPKKIFLIAEEFGESWVKLKKRDSSAYSMTEDVIDDLFRLSRATGITICLMDQAPESWSQQMRGNTKFAIIYKLSGKAAGAFEEHYLNDLPDVGVFSRGNVYYKAWHTDADIDMMSLPAQNDRLLTFDSTNEIDERSHERPTNGSAPTNTPFVATNGVANGELQETNATNGNSKGGTPKAEKKGGGAPPTAAVRAFARARRWDDFALAIYEKKSTQDATQADLRRWMSALDTDGKEPKAFKSEAFDLYHAYAPNGNRDKSRRTRGY